MSHPGRWISLLPILALVPRLGLSVIAADRQQVTQCRLRAARSALLAKPPLRSAEVDAGS
jgi:hypothetical protein